MVYSHNLRYSELIDDIWSDPASIPSDDMFDEIDQEYQALPRSIKLRHRPRTPIFTITPQVKRHIEIRKLLTEILTARPHHPFTQSVNGWYIEHGDITDTQLDTLRIVHNEYT